MPGEGILVTLRHAWLALEPLNLPMAVVGGVALSAWNHVRYARDADFLANEFAEIWREAFPGEPISPLA